ncbi:hypothetical protein PG993_014105 [Apiospora rasikravindrae]|uniref:Uncharacterized protein n=1 Tax=Apiospora rasikravindrae TaxID=990691 RepID=A0ABR1RT90_9PEZI
MATVQACPPRGRRRARCRGTRRSEEDTDAAAVEQAYRLSRLYVQCRFADAVGDEQVGARRLRAA